MWDTVASCFSCQIRYIAVVSWAGYLQHKDAILYSWYSELKHRVYRQKNEYNHAQMPSAIAFNSHVEYPVKPQTLAESYDIQPITLNNWRIT